MAHILYRRKKKSEDTTTARKNQRGGRLGKMLEDAVKTYFESLAKEGLRNRIEKLLPGINLDSFVLKKLRRYLSSRRSILLGRGLGRIDVQYRRGGIQLEPSGPVRLVIRRITVTDSQLLSTFNDIINQIQDKYTSNSDYIMSKIDDILVKLSETGIYKPSTPDEKTLYDLALLILLNHYGKSHRRPQWLEPAMSNLGRGEFVEEWINSLAEQISGIILNMSENLYFDFKVTFDSPIIRAALNRKTNKGQISRLLLMMDIDVRKIIYGIAENYVSPSFIKGAGELIGEIAGSFLSDVRKSEGLAATRAGKFTAVRKTHKELSRPTQLTMVFGKDVMSERAFKWYTQVKTKSFIEVSKSEDFSDSFKIESICKRILKPKPVINLGVIASYSISPSFEHTVQLNGLCPGGKYFYRIICEQDTKFSDEYSFSVGTAVNGFKFIVFADSQGMIKHDYDVFLKVFKGACEVIKDSSFVVHMGDFVDDGSNEDYWEWILNSELWCKNVLVPLSGNHEAKINPAVYRAGVENSILRHFNLQGLPEQELSRGAYYSFVYGNVLFIVLNTNSIDDLEKLDKKQYSWALECALNSNEKWKVLLTHKSPYSNGPHRGDADVRNIGEQIIDLVYEAEIDLVIGGHDHVYVRTPVMSRDREIECKRKKILRKGRVYDTFIDPDGAVFIVPGTSGVKNYKLNMCAAFPSEVMEDTTCPVYSEVEAKDNHLYFTSFKYNIQDGTSQIFECFAIEKVSNRTSDIDGKKVRLSINSISCMPGVNHSRRLNRVYSQYNLLEYSERIEIDNFARVKEALKLDSAYNKIKSCGIEVVSSADEFIKAFLNTNVSTIITDCDEIRLGGKFGFSKKLCVNRDLCIRGDARLVYVTFKVLGDAVLILGDSVNIDNCRSVFSIYPSFNALELCDGSSLILDDFASVRCGYGIGPKGHGVYVSGPHARVFLNSSSESRSSAEFILAEDSRSKIFINKGVYSSSGKKYAVDSKGYVEIAGGKIYGGKFSCKSFVSVKKGRILSPSGTKASIESSGEVKLEGGVIDCDIGSHIIMRGEDAQLIIKPFHKGALRIGEIEPFLGELEVYNMKWLKVSLENTSGEHGDIVIYSSLCEERLSPECIGTVRRCVHNGDIIRDFGNVKRVFMGTCLKNISVDGKVYCKDGALGYMISRLSYAGGSVIKEEQ